MVIFMELPLFLEAYYKWKYPEEYRDWEGKSVEEWYGKKYKGKFKWKIELIKEASEFNFRCFFDWYCIKIIIFKVFLRQFLFCI